MKQDVMSLIYQKKKKVVMSLNFVFVMKKILMKVEILSFFFLYIYIKGEK
jgi:hypothetical protein